MTLSPLCQMLTEFVGSCRFQSSQALLTGLQVQEVRPMPTGGLSGDRVLFKQRWQRMQNHQ